ncbi:hypothetical protein [Phaeacidiphilus oryzae]|jgi:hypothetical protein|uniref:hypothetical protein n=1 Tax=Phaeacidiphilus oryzae TaxID=348818 RepID=UPI00056A4BC4|nr:hypothetical protein [Phaeacidiphilus oryzae]
MSIPRFGSTEFQLVLLRRMADFNPDLVDRAVRELGETRTSMREANRRWQAMIRSSGFPRGARRHPEILGPPERTLRRRFGDLVCTARQWTLPLWPDLRFEVLLAPGGGAPWNEWLVRADAKTAPTPATVAELTPWSCVVADVAAAFPPAVPREGSAPTRSQLDFTDPQDGSRWTADFTHGLLQEVRPANSPEPQFR